MQSQTITAFINFVIIVHRFRTSPTKYSTLKVSMFGAD